ncbi:squalene/phytoene synthase family protein [Streptomyces sp. NPDC048290]|uniref:squalene/phytoene synthase family protein n=1 Tax=Streptomyces sp. NPDC048290 TaxID=3155811 RepID=UPI0034395366
MSAWTTALDAARITDPALRTAYTRQRALVLGYRRTAAVALQALLPRPLVPHALAATAFMHHSDNVLEGKVPGTDWDGWAAATRATLTTGAAPGPGTDPLLRTVAHTADRHPALTTHITAYLETATADRDFTGFATESDYQAYVDAYSLPAFLLVAGLVAPTDPEGAAAHRAACRSFIDAGQRLDFTNDLAEDLADGRLTLPADALVRHGVTRADLEQARDTAAVRALIAEQLDRAAVPHAAARATLPAATPAPYRPLVRALLTLDTLTLKAARAKGPALLRAPASPAPLPALLALTREYLHTRRTPRPAPTPAATR